MPASEDNLKQLAIALGGGALGALLLKNHYDESRKSRAEKDDPECVRYVCEVIGELLEEWAPSDRETENQYTASLFRYLNRKLDEMDLEVDIDVEMQPDTEHGCPDILINDMLALELKVAPNKAERDRLIGQCSGYSREWVTWAILIDSPLHEIGELERLLEAKNLHYIEVISYT